jgi:GntR family transcriptional regulator
MSGQICRGPNRDEALKKAYAARVSNNVDRKLRYEQIFETLRDRIAIGTYPIGMSLPTEAELCAEFNVSRFTAREALRPLVESGMISRRKGSGSYVTAKSPQIGYLQSMRSLSELFQYALDTRFDISRVRSVRIDAATRKVLAADAGSRWMCVEGIRLSQDGGMPICFTRVFIDNRFASVLEDVQVLQMPIYAAIEQRTDEIIAEAVQEISAARMPAEIAATIGRPSDDQALIVSRRYIGRDGVTLLCSFNWHPAERFRYTMRIRRGTFNALPQ